jgi:uncharacterized protein YkwD
MKLNFFHTFLLFTAVITMNSCSSDVSATPSNTNSKMIAEYSYTILENQTMDLMNKYRVSIGLNSLQQISYVSLKAEEHNNYMIANNVVNHNNFVARSEDIMKVVGAKTVGENIAYNYNTAQSVLDAWLASSVHKANIEGDFTHFGISIRTNPTTGAKYYTNIFVKI